MVILINSVIGSFNCPIIGVQLSYLRQLTLARRELMQMVLSRILNRKVQAIILDKAVLAFMYATNNNIPNGITKQ